MKKFEKIIFPVTIIVLFLLWEFWLKWAKVPAYRIPSPSSIFLQSKESYLLVLHHFKITLIELVIGASIGICLALFVGILFYWVPLLKNAFYLLARSVNSVPIPAIAIFIVLLFGVGIESKIVTATICVFFPIVSHTYHGLRATDPLKEKLMKSLNASRWQKLIYLELPSASAEIFTALETAVTVAVVGIIVGEMLGGNQGLGFYILNHLYRMDNPKVLLATFFAALLGIMAGGGVHYLKKKLIPWHPSVRQ